MSGDMYEGGTADDRAVVGTISCYVNDNINNIPTESTLSVGGKRKKEHSASALFEYLVLIL